MPPDCIRSTRPTKNIMPVYWGNTFQSDQFYLSHSMSTTTNRKSILVQKKPIWKMKIFWDRKKLNCEKGQTQCIFMSVNWHMYIAIVANVFFILRWHGRPNLTFECKKLFSQFLQFILHFCWLKWTQLEKQELENQLLRQRKFNLKYHKSI